MRALVVTGSRADRNGLEVVHDALAEAGHHVCLTHPFSHEFECDADVAIVGGDRIEILNAAVELAERRIPIAHIAGGDVTVGSADDRYRDAITALSCIHFATNEFAHRRLLDCLAHLSDKVELTGSPAIDRLHQTPLLEAGETFERIGAHIAHLNVLVCVHPNTVGNDRLADCRAVVAMLKTLDTSTTIVGIGANADVGGPECNAMLAPLCNVFTAHVEPQVYYSLMQHSDVMVGNSSAMLYEAPSFGLPCVLVGDRQNGRMMPDNIYRTSRPAIEDAAEHGRIICENPYGDGKSAPRIVKALEENAWRWTKQS